jgi:hypothetical protein
MSRPFAPIYMIPPPFQNDGERWGTAGWHLTTTMLFIVYGFHYIVTLGKIDGDPT